jgi:hypothetical protein
MIRITAAAAISTSLAMISSAVSIAAETPVRIAQAAESDQTHQHPPATADNGHQHGGTGDGPVHVELQTNPATLQAGSRAELVFALDDASGQPVDELLTHHSRKLHVVIVSEDMHVLGHIHPEDFGEAVQGGSAKAYFTFPQAGRYLVGVDFMTTAQGAQNGQFVVEVEGPRAAPKPEAEAPSGMVVVTLEEHDTYTEPALLQAADQSLDYAVSLQQPDAIRANEEVTFAYRFVKDGAPLTDLRPYLDAPMHLAVAKVDLTAFLHTHGTLPKDAHAAHGDHGSAEVAHGEAHGGPDTFGPEIAATVTFPEPGTYYLFAQAAHGDRLLISRFPVHVE